MLDIDMKFIRGILFVRLKGILNGDTAIKLDEELSEIVKVNGIKFLLINLDDLGYIDKYGIDIITKNYKYILNNDGKLMICGLSNNLDYKINKRKNLYQINDENVAFGLVEI